MALIGDLEWYRGDSFPITLTVKTKTVDDVPGVPIDITGYTFLMTVNSVKDPTTIEHQMFQVNGVLDADPTTGKVVFTPTTGQTDIPPAKYYYDVQMTDNAGHVRTVAKFKLVIRQDITKDAISSTEYSSQFDNDDLVGGVLTVVHGLNDPYPIITVYDGNNELVDFVMTPIDDDSFSIDFGGAITGDWFITVRSLPYRFAMSFDNDDLDVDHKIIVTHPLGVTYPSVTIYDGNNELADATVTSIDSTSFEVNCGLPITGTWNLVAI